MRNDEQSTRRIALGLGYAAVSAAIAVFAAFPVYASAQYVVVAVAAVVIGLVIAGASRLWAWAWWATSLMLLGAFVALGLGLAIPGAWTSPWAVLQMLRDLATGATTAFKDLLTVDLPVDGYRNLLIPVLLVLLIGPAVTALLAWRSDRWGALAAVPALAMPMFGLLFGRTATSAPAHLGPLVVPAPAELTLGAAALVSTVTWLSWRAHVDRREALRRAAVTSGVRVSRRRRPASDARRVGLGAGMLVIAVVGGVAVAPAIADGRSRDVLRSGTGPELAISRTVSPLSEYRTHFATDDAVDRVLFRVESEQGPLPDRIRLAVLTSYDGATFRVADDDAEARFTRVPSMLTAAPGEESTVRVEVDGLGGIWLPTFGSLRQVSFDGANGGALSDAFYYSTANDAGVETSRGGLQPGDAYTVTATEPAARSLAGEEAPGTDPAVDVPDSVVAWMDAQAAGTGGTALQDLVARLRERGYLSHALAVPETGAAWADTLGAGYVFQPSPSGHSLSRIDAIFTDLLRRQNAAADEGAGASLVAAVGDDEQFAVAAALVAEQLGFPARVVVGARLAGADAGVPACADGVCTGRNVTAWLEVATQDGAWVPLDVTPQHEVGLDSAVTRERDPEVPTQVRPEAAREVVPPDPVQQDTQDTTPPEDAGADLSALWATLRISGLVLLVLAALLGPLLVVVAAKALRRRSRRGAGSPAARIVGGWDEYVDAAVDTGLPMPRVDTRSELASAYATPEGSVLAVAADRAVFSGREVTASESEEFWRIVDDERRRFSASASPWRRLIAAVSLTSFTRGLGPRPRAGRAVAPRRTGRRGRRRTDDAR